MCDEAELNDDEHQEEQATPSDLCLIYPASILSGAINTVVAHLMIFCIRYWWVVLGLFGAVAAAGWHHGTRAGFDSALVFIALTACLTVPLGLALAYVAGCFFMTAFFAREAEARVWSQALWFAVVTNSLICTSLQDTLFFRELPFATWALTFMTIAFMVGAGALAIKMDKSPRTARIMTAVGVLTFALAFYENFGPLSETVIPMENIQSDRCSISYSNRGPREEYLSCDVHFTPQGREYLFRQYSRTLDYSPYETAGLTALKIRSGLLRHYDLL